ncbi:hypothetical protein N8D56_08425 [Devosia sp. A8/3-2]|nr:hypothetical protein N8D56_08425 [Devosia sp. A8/3-2]
MWKCSERETFLSAINLGAKVLVQLGVAPIDAHHMAQAFERHDNQLLTDSFAVREDEDAYVGMVRQSMSLLNETMQGDEQPSPLDKKDSPRGE